jgi:predicted Fe-Mo cluster-binding NifX family protein
MAINEHFEREKLVEVAVTHNEVEANIIKSLLEAAGIDCLLVGQITPSVYPVNVDGLGEFKIKVLDHSVEAAKTVIQDYENQDFESTELIEEEPPE